MNLETEPEKVEYCVKVLLTLCGKKSTILGLMKNETAQGFDVISGRGNIWHISKNSDYQIYKTNQIFRRQF